MVSGMRGRSWTGVGWEPDRRASLGLALAAGTLLCLAFLGLLYRPLKGSSPAFLSLSVIHTPLRSRAVRPRRAPVAGPSVLPPPRIEPLPPVPGFILLQQQVDSAVQGTVLGGQSEPFLMPPAQKYDELDRALRARDKPWNLQQGESYRSEYGDSLVKSGGGCAAMHEIQVTPGGVKATVGFAVPCPGEDQPSMADQLAEWADKRAQEAKPPQH
jgi:hypothetical protein